MIIGTPGTLLDWILRFRRFDTKKISIFVLDEADVMISTQGHQDQSTRIKKYSHFCDVFFTFTINFIIIIIIIKKSQTTSAQYLPKLFINETKIPTVENGKSFKYLGRIFNFSINNIDHKLKVLE